ncbi:succinate dehydrogenase assembly factor 2 [Thiobacillus denitrificans]|uniref:FAD assembly factor SdhE n=1 Tax=Thiobacillus denitrificans TaxID=36861 RepID=UPI0000463404|nr:succinate dehydrogenase assembly factor 2 [Thiobacillus denitrificans]
MDDAEGAGGNFPDDAGNLQSARIAWRCRRGLLELDLWLGGFWAAQRATLRSRETAAFVRLLALSDMEILDRLHGRSAPDDADVDALIQRLKNFREAK